METIATTRLTANGADEPARMITRRLIAVAVVCGLGMFFDGLELTMSNAFGAIFTPARGIATEQLALLISAALVGGALGAPLLGLLADRIGRRRALTTSLGGFGLLSLVCALTPDIGSLTIARFFASFCIGAYQPVMASYVVEVFPRSSSGRFILWISVAGGLGSTSSMLMASLLAKIRGFPVEGWRGALYIGGAGGIAVAIAAWRVLPESPRWLRAMGREQDAAAAQTALTRTGHAQELQTVAAPTEMAPVWQPARLARLFERRYLARLALFMLFEVLVTCALGFLILQGAIFAARGNSETKALIFGGIAVLGTPLGSLLVSLFADKVKRPVLIACLAGMMAALSIGFIFVPNGLISVIFAASFNLMLGAYATLVLLLGAEMFPSEMRARASTIGYVANRIGLALIPLAGLKLIHGVGVWAFLTLIAGSQICMVVLVLTVGTRVLTQDAGRARPVQDS